MDSRLLAQLVDFVDNDDTEKEQYLLWQKLPMNQHALYSAANVSDDVLKAVSYMVTEREQHEKIQEYVEIIDRKSNEHFFKTLRVSKATSLTLIEILEKSSVFIKEYRGGNNPVAVKTILYMVLVYLSSQASQREVSEKFNCSQGFLSKSISDVCHILAENSTTYIKWPAVGDYSNVARSFKQLAGFPGVVSAIDGCHISVNVPDRVQADYLDRTFRHSVNLMAACDANKVFTYCNVGFPGSAHDQRVLSESPLGNVLTNDRHRLFASSQYHIIGDSAFTLHANLLVPFKDFGTLTGKQRKYNRKLSQTRCIIENAFGLLKGRFRRLKYICYKLSIVPEIILACCVIHNICLSDATDRSDLLQIDNSDDLSDPACEHQGQAYAGYLMRDGRDKRNEIVNML